MTAITKELKIEGFIITRFKNKFPMAFKEMKQWITEVGCRFVIACCDAACLHLNTSRGLFRRLERGLQSFRRYFLSISFLQIYSLGNMIFLQKFMNMTNISP